MAELCFVAYLSHFIFIFVAIIVVSRQINELLPRKLEVIIMP